MRKAAEERKLRGPLRYPSCLGANDNLSFTQTFTVTVNGKQFPLSTVVGISLGKFSGNPEDNVNITTP